MGKINFGITPLTDQCENIYKEKEHVCIGISPYNSLFSEEYISQLISWCMENFEDFHLFLPDEPTMYTLKSLGYSDEKCKKKLKKQINWLKNKIKKALLQNGIELEKHSEYLLDWQRLVKNPVFKSELDNVYLLYKSNDEFKENCLQASKWVLLNKVCEDDLTSSCLETAVNYFLCELPLFAATSRIVGKKSSIFCYHQSIDFHKKLYDRKMSYVPHDKQGYGVINFQ